MTKSTFARRRITLGFTLGEGNFGESGSDTFTIEGLRVSCSIVRTGGVTMSDAQLRVFGMPLDVMNKLTILGANIAQVRRNQINIQAGDDDNGLATVFQGEITEAWVDTRNSPQIAFVVVAHTGVLAAMAPMPATSFKGSVDVATVLQGITSQMDPVRTLVNNGVDVQLADPYLYGTALQQIQDLARQGNFNFELDTTALTVWPVDGSRDEQEQTLSAETGMVGYPMHTEAGIAVTTLYNPSLVYGALINVESELKPASGLWRVANVMHDLESEMPGGKWFTRVDCNTMDKPIASAG